MTPEDSARLGVTVLASVVVASGILWFTLFRLVRWAVPW